MRKILYLAVIFSLILPVQAGQTVRVKSMECFSAKEYFIDLVQTNSCYGESTNSILKRTQSSGAVCAVNGSFFGRKHNGSIFPIGTVLYRGKDITVCHAPAKRGYISFDSEPRIGFVEPAKNSIFAISGGPILIQKREVLTCFYGNFKPKLIYSNRLRTIVAIKDDNFFFIRIHGNLPEIAEYLSKYGFESVINLDGGTSSQDDKKVANGIVVYPKTRPFYQQYCKKYF